MKRPKKPTKPKKQPPKKKRIRTAEEFKYIQTRGFKINCAYINFLDNY